MGINFDFFSISLLLGGFIALMSGVVVYVHNHKTTENIAWFLFNITSSVWSFGYFATINAPSYKFAYTADWILHLAAVLIPLFCLVSVISITKNEDKHKFWVTLFSVAGLFFLISTPTKMFVRDVVPKANFKFVPDAGPLYIYFTIYFFVLVMYVLSVLYLAMKGSDDSLVRRRLRYMLIFTTVGSIGGGSVFFLTFNVPFLPYPLIVFPLFPLISIYAIFRLQLFDVKVVTSEAIVFFLWIFVLIRTTVSNTVADAVINTGLLVSLVIGGVLLIQSVIKEVKLREELDISNKKLKEANEGQVSLMHFMNHQVKGRFGNAKNIFAELLTEDYGKMPDQARPLLEKGLDETNMGIDYVQNVLRGASAENGEIPYDMKPLDFREIVEREFKKEKDKMDGKGLKSDLKIQDGEYKMQGDARELGEAVRNLIDNSINYTPAGSISLELSQDKYAVKLNISDTGIGIIEEDKMNLFKSGVRGKDSLKVNVNSTGYGLAFVKGVVDAHKGRVWAESDGKDKGSTFFVELPKG